MMARQSPLYWSFGVGTWFGTSVRISVFFPVILLILCLRLENFALGAVVSGILFVSVLLHEFGHVFTARATGGSGDEILMWPLGGLAFVEPARNFQSQALTSLAGPLTNLLLCALSLPWVLSASLGSSAWNPLVLPAVDLQVDAVAAVMLLTFSLNWMLLLLNLVPIFPLDGGRVVQAWLSHHWGATSAAEISIRIGLVAAVALGITAVLTETMWLLGLSFFVILMALQEFQRVQAGEYYDDSFMGYDFSQGYTSLEKSQPVATEPKPSRFRRWLERRRAEKRRRQEQLALEEEMQLDALLAKLHEHGMSALTEAEKRQLQRASARYRDKGKSAS